MRKTIIAKRSYNPAARFNSMIKHVASNPYIIKIDPEIVIKNAWVVSEIATSLEIDSNRMYNARTHFTEGNDWYSNFDEIISNYENHYHFAEGGPFSRSKFYFCSGFSRNKFVELGGIDELFTIAVG